ERFWARVWTPHDLNMDFYDLANIRPVARDAPSVIASNAIHAHASMTLADDHIVMRTLVEIAQFAPEARRARLRHAVVHRIPMAVPCPLPGTESLRPPNLTPLHGVWIAGDWTRTALPASMESAARSGRLAAEQVAARLGRALAISKPPPETTGAIALLRHRSGFAPG
ncbi:MAG TPA: FAD-dependent oxidoreductase, partial [Albitalea sp.]|nr:FAD-dependent oxidoreductase [Albitalea sp.]